MASDTGFPEKTKRNSGLIRATAAAYLGDTAKKQAVTAMLQKPSLTPGRGINEFMPDIPSTMEIMTDAARKRDERASFRKCILLSCNNISPLLSVSHNLHRHSVRYADYAVADIFRLLHIHAKSVGTVGM